MRFPEVLSNLLEPTVFLDTLLAHPRVRPAAEILLFYMTDVANLKLVSGATRGTIQKKKNLQQEMLIKEKHEKQVSSRLLQLKLTTKFSIRKQL